jgi:hypothetical protein
MVEKLKSISKRISWSLLLRAIIFAAAWWALPFWLFLIIALYLYYVPITGADKVSAPFWVLLLISFLESQGIIDAIVLAAIFYFILLIKDLIIIDRRSAYEILILVLSYLLARGFFLNVGGALSYQSLFDSVIAAWAVSLMAGSFIKNFLPGDSGEMRAPQRMLGWMIFILMWQLLIVGLFLPLDFLYQSAVVFLIAVIILDVIPQYIFGELSRVKMLATGSVIFSLLVIVLASARWGL